MEAAGVRVVAAPVAVGHTARVVVQMEEVVLAAGTGGWREATRVVVQMEVAMETVGHREAPKGAAVEWVARKATAMERAGSAVAVTEEETVGSAVGSVALMAGRAEGLAVEGAGGGEEETLAASAAVGQAAVGSSRRSRRT